MAIRWFMVQGSWFAIDDKENTERPLGILFLFVCAAEKTERRITRRGNCRVQVTEIAPYNGEAIDERI